MRLQIWLSLLVCWLIPIDAQLPDITYTTAWYVLPYTPMANLYNFIQSLNTKDSTTKAKLDRATKFISNNWGKPKVQNATMYNTKAKAQTAFAALIKHRAAVKDFWDNQLNTQMAKLFGGNTDKVKPYKQMYMQVDRTYDQDFWTVINNWYMFSYYHIAQDKRDPLYDKINTAISNYYAKTGENNNPIDFSVWPYPEYVNYMNNTFFNGYW